MRRGWIAALVAIATVAMVFLGTWHHRHGEDRTDTPWVLGYYVGYLKDAYPLDAVDWSAMTHVVVGAATPRPDGSLDTSFFLEEDVGRTWARKVVQRAHEHDRRAVLMVGGANSRDAFASAASAAHRQRLVREILSAIDEYGFDGVDIDWEPLQEVDGQGISALANDLRRERPDLDMTMAIGPVNINEPHRTVLSFIPSLAPVFDRLNMMTYGMNGGWDGWNSWHNSALAGQSPETPMSIDASVRAYVAAGVPRERLGLGIGFFGSCMTGVSGPGQSAPTMRIEGADNAMSYRNIVQHYLRPKRWRWDEGASVPYLTDSAPFGPLGCTYVTYEDERSIRKKAEYAKQQNLGGAIIWNINQGYVPDAPDGQQDPLMRAVRQGFLE